MFSAHKQALIIFCRPTSLHQNCKQIVIKEWDSGTSKLIRKINLYDEFDVSQNATKTYHIGVIWGFYLLVVQILPIYGTEEWMNFDVLLNDKRDNCKSFIENIFLSSSSANKTPLAIL